MDSIELERVERRVRIKYEWSRLRRGVAGFTPVLVVVAAAALLSKHPASALTFGALMFVAGAILLWYGRDLRRAVLPGVLIGLVPMTLALCANHVGHFCTGERCMALCVPACVCGGLLAGLGVAWLGHRARRGFGFWAAASGLALLTGAMGCACVGYSGVVGLAIGFAVGSAPALLQKLGVFSRR